MGKRYLRSDDDRPVEVPKVEGWSINFAEFAGGEGMASSIESLPDVTGSLDDFWDDEASPVWERLWMVGDEWFVAGMQLRPYSTTIDITLTDEGARAFRRGVRQLIARTILDKLARTTRPRQRKDYLRRLRKRIA